MTEQAIETYLNENKDRFLEELKDFLRIPSVSADPSHDDDMKHCAKWVRDHLLSLGMETAEIHETDGHPLIYAAHCKHPDKPTVLLYGHYDVQPPDPLELWHSQPFDPTVRDGKIFARGATDDKGQVFAHFKGIESLFKTYG